MQKYVNIDENVMLLSDLLIVKVDGGGGGEWNINEPFFAMESSYSSWNWFLTALFILGFAFIFVFLEAW